MNSILVKNAFDAFDYVMDHYYPFGMSDFAERSDTYAVISIQDSHNGGFGFRFTKNAFCRDVLTLLFDDIEREVEGAVLFSDDMADSIIDFIRSNSEVETLLIHCYGGQSRSRAVGAFALKMTGRDNAFCFEEWDPNMYVYDTLIRRSGL